MHARHALVQGYWAYRHHVNVSRHYISTSPEHFDWIVGKHGIMADEDCLFRIGLSDQQPVKGGLVMHWQVLQGQDMLEGDWQDLDIVGLLLLSHYIRQGETRCNLPGWSLICISQTLAH